MARVLYEGRAGADGMQAPKPRESQGLAMAMAYFAAHIESSTAAPEFELRLTGGRERGVIFLDEAFL